MMKSRVKAKTQHRIVETKQKQRQVSDEIYLPNTENKRKTSEKQIRSTDAETKETCSYTSSANYELLFGNGPQSQTLKVNNDVELHREDMMSSAQQEYQHPESMTSVASERVSSSNILDELSNQISEIVELQYNALPEITSQDDEPSLKNIIKYIQNQNFKEKNDNLPISQLNTRVLRDIVDTQEYWCFGKFFIILKKFLNPETFDFYFKSLQIKLNLQQNQLSLLSVKFSERGIESDQIKHSIKGLAKSRMGYCISETVEFYTILRKQHLLIRNIEDFELLILPIFYLLHGEAYDSQDPLTKVSYNTKVTKNQINIFCLKCKNDCNWHSTLSFEFQFHNKDSHNNPFDITLHRRGNPCHALHYLKSHGYMTEGMIDQGNEGSLIIDNRPITGQSEMEIEIIQDKSNDYEGQIRVELIESIEIIDDLEITQQQLPQTILIGEEGKDIYFQSLSGRRTPRKILRQTQNLKKRTHQEIENKTTNDTHQNQNLNVAIESDSDEVEIVPMKRRRFSQRI